MSLHHLCVCLCPIASAHRSEIPGSQELELQVVVSYLAQVLGTTLKSPSGTACDLNMEPSLRPPVFSVTSKQKLGAHQSGASLTSKDLGSTLLPPANTTLCRQGPRLLSTEQAIRVALSSLPCFPRLDLKDFKLHTLVLWLCGQDGSTCPMLRLEMTGQLLGVSSLLLQGPRDLTLAVRLGGKHLFSHVTASLWKWLNGPILLRWLSLRS